MVQRTPQAYLIFLLFLIFAPPGGMSAFARQTPESIAPQQDQESEAPQQDLDELEQILIGGNRNQKTEALVAIGSGDDQLERRIGLIANAMASSDRSLQSICKISIQRMGGKAKPTVQKFLDSPERLDSIHACGIISALASEGDEFAEQIIQILKDGDPAQRHAALFALQNLSPAAIVDAVEPVTKELDSKDFNTQCRACAVLRQAGVAAEPATARLVKLLSEGNVSARSRAAQALAAIGPVEGYDIQELIARLLAAPTHVEKTRALEALGDLGLEAVNQLDRIEALMQDASKNCRCDAALAYYRVSGKTEKPLEVLLEEVATRSQRVPAIECLGGMQAGAADAVPALIEYLDDEDPVVAETTVLALKNIGPAANAALPKLQAMAKNEDFFMSAAVGEAIEAITSTPKSSSL